MLLHIKIRVSVTFLASCIFFLPCQVQARLDESKIDTAARYGAPVKLSNLIMLPLHKNIPELRYLHHGWFIRSSYLNDRTVIISYKKHVKQGSNDAYLKKDEINAILKAESGGYQWIKVKKGLKISNSKKYQKSFQSATATWKRGDGALAGVFANRAVTIVSQEAMDFDLELQTEKEKQRKSNTQHF